jgi:hypothetical protein
MTTATAPKVTFGQALSAGFSTIFHLFTAAEKAAVTVEKSIGLAENEVDNLSELQMIRLDESKAERAKALKALALKSK